MPRRIPDAPSLISSQIAVESKQFYVQPTRSASDLKYGHGRCAERTAVCGVSASGELVLAIGLCHAGV